MTGFRPGLDGKARQWPVNWRLRARFQEVAMLLHLPIAILTTLAPIPVSDTVPKFDIAKECRFEGGSSQIYDRRRFNGMRNDAMATSFAWGPSVEAYHGIYSRLAAAS
jgi:hypothetical protein